MSLINDDETVDIFGSDDLKPQEEIGGLGHVSVIAVFTSLAGVMMGYSTGVFSGVIEMESFQKSYLVQGALGEGLFTTFLTAAAGVAPLLFAGSLGDQLGRKPLIVGSGLLYSLGSIITFAAPDGVSSLWMVYAGRAITGFGVGGISSVVPVYMSEIAPKRVRGALGMLWQLAVTIGIMLSFWTNSILIGVRWDWRWAVGLQVVPALHLVCGMLQLSDTPRWYLLSGQEDNADQALMLLRRSRAPHVRREFLEMQMDARRHGTDADNSWEHLWRSRPRTIGIGVALQVLQQLTGINAIVYYAPQLLRHLEIRKRSRLIFQGANGSINFFSTLIAIYYIDTVGRRSLLSFGSAMIFFTLLCAGIIGLATEGTDNQSAERAAAYSTVATVFLFIFNFAYSWGMIWLVCAELIPLRFRQKGCAVTTSANWFMSSLVAFVVPFLTGRLASVLYVMFSCSVLFSLVFVRRYLPETKGRGLEEVERLCDEMMAGPRAPSYAPLLQGGLDYSAMSPFASHTPTNPHAHARGGDGAGGGQRKSRRAAKKPPGSAQLQTPKHKQGVRPNQAAAAGRSVSFAGPDIIDERASGGLGDRLSNATSDRKWDSRDGSGFGGHHPYNYHSSKHGSDPQNIKEGMSVLAGGQQDESLGGPRDKLDTLSALCALDIVFAVLVNFAFLLLQALSEVRLGADGEGVVQNSFFGIVWTCVSIINNVFILMLYRRHWLLVLFVWKVFEIILLSSYALLSFILVFETVDQFLAITTSTVALMYFFFNVAMARILWLRAGTQEQYRQLGTVQRMLEDAAQEGSVSIRDVQFKKVPIGTGANAKVYLGMMGSEKLAIKEVTYHRGIQENTAFRAKCEKEVWILKRLRNHPNIVRYYGCEWEYPHFYIIMEYCNDNLRDFLDRRERESKYRNGGVSPEKDEGILRGSGEGLEWGLMLNFAMQICRGMRMLHERREPIIHFDLKPSNILIKGRYTLKITDYGDSRVVEEKGLRYKTLPAEIGTPHWMAPEMISDHFRRAPERLPGLDPPVEKSISAVTPGSRSPGGTPKGSLNQSGTQGREASVSGLSCPTTPAPSEPPVKAVEGGARDAKEVVEGGSAPAASVLRTRYTTRVDVYSYAVILWELMSGFRPYPGWFLMTIFRHVARGGRPSPAPNLGTAGRDKLYELIQQAWSQDPKNRPSFRNIFEVLARLEGSGEFGISMARNLMETKGMSAAAKKTSGRRDSSTVSVSDGSSSFKDSSMQTVGNSSGRVATNANLAVNSELKHQLLGNVQTTDGRFLGSEAGK